ncbi:MAG: hypothetical protein Q7W45_07960 [Bacteroidota bacterium]|nr:hypothetical protein [Bacteroidota bacterium]MDP3145971.1 hypothetical protein [Bacteroidota bacterium]
MPTQKGYKVKLINCTGLYKIICNIDEPKSGLYYPKNDLNWFFELKSNFDYVVIPIENSHPYFPMFTQDGKIIALNIYNHQIEKIV